ncbi:hypothetical protein FHS67_006145 [Aminobacter aminovorans]|uniref:Uncharacterized protein n=1 Tax=Aminobacter aminovorans TaxID=83263 RepID=A0ABR6HGV5_AMIAI|nr:hypothetical protein [Aminobacter aminovorans]
MTIALIIKAMTALMRDCHKIRVYRISQPPSTGTVIPVM